VTRIVVALGGNALMPTREADPGEAQRVQVATAADAVAALAHHSLVLTHGNGPQVGLLALDAESSGREYTMDVLGAATEGRIGYVLEREIRSRLPTRPIVTLLTQVEEDPDDPAFLRPSKPIGPVYDRATADRLARNRGWTSLPEGDGWRRVVPSPLPRRILELDAVELLLGAGHLVICAGGGGIPVAVDPRHGLVGVEGVIDKDRSAALLARGLDADYVLFLTDVDAIYEDWPARQRPVKEVKAADLLGMPLAAGSMGPKAEAAAAFASSGKGMAVIGALQDAVAMLAGDAGTRVVA
jgi:carbamate kinase